MQVGTRMILTGGHLICFGKVLNLFSSFEPKFGFLQQLMRILHLFAIFDPKFEDFKNLGICSLAIPINKGFGQFQPLNVS